MRAHKQLTFVLEVKAALVQGPGPHRTGSWAAKAHGLLRRKTESFPETPTVNDVDEQGSHAWRKPRWVALPCCSPAPMNAQESKDR